MPSAKKTPNYNLTQYADNGTDKVSFMGDYNEDMSKIDTALNDNANNITAKADKATTYTKTDVDGKLAAKANTSDMTTALAAKADTSDIVKNKTLVSVKAYGAKGDGTTDDTESIRNAITMALAEGGSLYFPSGIYYINKTNIDVSGIELFGAKNAILKGNANYSDPLFVSSGNTYIHDINSRLNIYSVLLKYLEKSSKITIENVNAIVGRIVLGSDPSISGKGLTTNVKISHCSASSWAGGTATGAIDIVGTDGAIVTDNYCVNSNRASSGIMFWGSDSSTITENSDKNVKNLVIANNVCGNVEGGAIWGSAGEKINIHGNVCFDTNDVGIDLEGCVDSIITENMAKNCPNGNYAIINGFNRVIISNNYSEFSDDSLPVHRHVDMYFPNSKTGVWDRINTLGKFVGNIFINKGTTVGSLDFVSSFGSIEFLGNSFINSMLNIGNGQAVQNSYVKNNTFRCNNSASYDMIASNATSDTCEQVIDGNSFADNSKTPASNALNIKIVDNYNGRHTVIVKNNTINRPTLVSATVLATVTFYHNVFSSEANAPQPTGNQLYLEYESNKVRDMYKSVDKSTYPYPHIQPTTGNWKIGQKIELYPPTNHLGVIATASGSAPAWKKYGAITE